MQKTVLVVDDDLNSREGLKRSLAGGGVEVDTAADGLEAIKRLKEGDVAVAIIDLDLPPVHGVPITGWDLVRICRAFNGEMPIIVVTAEGGAGVRARAKELRVLEYLEKPIVLRRLREIVRAIDPYPRQGW